MTIRTRVLVPSGVLGLGFDSQALDAAVKLKPDVICIDGGSTDSGPFSLGTGTSKYSRAVCVREWRQLMQARSSLGVPLIIGSSGTCGSDAMVDWMYDITQEIAAETGESPRIARLYSEQDKPGLVQAFRQGRISALDPAQALDEPLIHSCTHIVALAGAEQIQAALHTGADIVIAGRTTDTALVSALPLARNCHAGAAWHAAKIAECGALCSTHPTSGVVIVDIDTEGFTIYPTADGACCTPHSVSAHMLYENTDPFILHEPGGYLDVTDAHYEALDERRVRVTGSRWVPVKPFTLKLEGARLSGYQTTLLALLRNSHYVNNARSWVDRLDTFLRHEINASLNLAKEQYRIDFRLIGVDATLGELETRNSAGHEIGVLVIITAETQALADEIGKLVNPFLLHYPLTDNEPLPTFAFPYSPAQTTRGALYEFCLNHTVALEEPMNAVRLEVNGPEATPGKTTEAMCSETTSHGTTTSHSTTTSHDNSTSNGTATSQAVATSHDTGLKKNSTNAAHADEVTQSFNEVVNEVVNADGLNDLPDLSFASKSDRPVHGFAVADIVDSVRSKNAGPFWVTIDIFCGSRDAYLQVSHGLNTSQVATALGQPESAVKRFTVESLNVVKFSVHRPVIQGHPDDRDLHGAQWSMLIEELLLR